MLELVGQTPAAPTQTQIQVAIAQRKFRLEFTLKLKTRRAVKSTLRKPHGTDQLKLMGRKRTKKIPPIHPEPLCTLPLALLPPPAEEALASPNSVSTSHASSMYVSANETQSQTGQPPYSYHRQPASPASEASTKSPDAPHTPLFVQQRACQSPAVDGVRARVII